MNDTVEFNTLVGDKLNVTAEGEFNHYAGDKTYRFDWELTKVYITTDTAKNDILYLLGNLDKNILASKLWDECHQAIEDALDGAAEARADAKRDNMMFGG